MEVSVSTILQSIYLFLIVAVIYRAVKWLSNYIYRMIVVNKMKGLEMYPFIGSLHLLKSRKGAFILSICLFDSFTYSF